MLGFEHLLKNLFMNKKIRVGITQGDFNGVGPEVALKAVAGEGICELFTPVIFSDWRIIEYARKQFGLDQLRLHRTNDASDIKDNALNVVDLHLADTTIEAGKPTKTSGAGAVAALEAATAALHAGNIDVLVTAPISKEAAQSDTFHFAGHTEYLNAKAGDEYRAQMILFDGPLRVALVTTHLPLAEIPAAITSEKIVKGVEDLSATLRQDFGIVRPKIAVLSLNPHSGDGGLLGNEEQTVIIPAIKECNENRLLAFGPYPADGFFGSGSYRDFDGVLAMYHDQGLAPFKSLAGSAGVNFTAGLPFVRTSPDHGTAYDIAWQGIADPTSMREAIYAAIDIFRSRTRWQQASANPLRKAQNERPQKGERSQKGDKNRKEENQATSETVENLKAEESAEA